MTGLNAHSPYNLLVRHGRVVVIDLPHLVDVARRRVPCDAREVFAELVAELYH